MPIYAYRCEACGHAKDVLQKISDPLLTVCPSCGAPAFKKQLTAAGFQLKGSGWYVTDFRGGAQTSGDAAKSDTDKGESAKADAPKADSSKSDGGKTEGAKTESSKPGSSPAASPAPAPSSPAPPPASGGGSSSGTP